MLTDPTLRYAIDDGAADWTAAEAHVRAGAGKEGRASVISVKTNAPTSAKRKAEAEPESERGSAGGGGGGGGVGGMMSILDVDATYFWDWQRGNLWGKLL